VRAGFSNRVDASTSVRTSPPMPLTLEGQSRSLYAVATYGDLARRRLQLNSRANGRFGHSRPRTCTESPSRFRNALKADVDSSFDGAGDSAIFHTTEELVRTAKVRRDYTLVWKCHAHPLFVGPLL
jgi:hypothetical protein